MKLIMVTIFAFSASFGHFIKPSAIPMGDWEMKIKTPIGWKSSVMEISKEKGILYGKSSKFGKIEIAISGKKVSWIEESKTPFGKVTVKAIGTIDDSRKIIKGYSTILNGPMKGKKLKWTMRKQ